MSIRSGPLRATLSAKRRNYRSASEKLFADAEKEERDPDPELERTKQRLEQRLRQAENWNGEEKVEDAVLRMLVDKHKPLRGAKIQTADDKLKAQPPKVSGMPFLEPMNAKDVILPGIEGHKPWMTTYTTPSFAVNPSVRAMRLSPESANKRSKVDESDPIKGPTKEERARIAAANRLAEARERTIDYRFGGIVQKDRNTTEGSSGGGDGQRANPTTLKGWASLAEERINDARAKGLFDNIKGKGKPLQKEETAGNPFIPTDEFLLNRYVQRQGAVPPWVELQQELDTAVRNFRAVLQQAWLKRITRNLRTPYLYESSFVQSLTPEKAARLRDLEWEAKERSFYDHAIAELNTLVRRYNGIAPYTVRRGLYTRDDELAKCYTRSGQFIVEALAADPVQPQTRRSEGEEQDSRVSGNVDLRLSIWAQLVAAMRSVLRL